MNQRYESRKEYSLMDVLQYNLRKWWLAAVFAAVFAVIVGGYKAKTLMPYIDAEVYDDRMQVETSVLFSTPTCVARRTPNAHTAAENPWDEPATA